MKTLILGIFLLGFITSGHSQILLEEAKIDYKAPSMKLDPATNTAVIKIPEKRVGEFENDPITFMKMRFDAKKFVQANPESNYTHFLVNFVSKKGYLQARFSRDGDLISSVQKFKNKRLPQDVQVELASLYNGSNILSTKSFAHSKGWDIDKEYYKVKLDDGTKVRRVRIDRDNNRLSVAGL